MLKISTPFHPVALDRFKHRIILNIRIIFAASRFKFFSGLEYILKLRNARKKCK
jgi:hypothetical protein